MFQEVIMAKQEHNIIPRARNSVRKWMKEQSLPYKELISYYTCAMMEVETRFRVLDEDFSIKYDRNPIESIKTRINNRRCLRCLKMLVF